MSIVRLACLLAASLLLGACGAKQCRINNDYKPVSEVGPLKNPQSYALPQPDPTYHIPELADTAPAPAAPVATGKKGRVRAVDCLDFPPALPPDAPAAPAAS